MINGMLKKLITALMILLWSQGMFAACGGGGGPAVPSPLEKIGQLAATNPAAINNYIPPPPPAPKQTPLTIENKVPEATPKLVTVAAQKPLPVGKVVWVKGSFKAVYMPDMYAKNKKVRDLKKDSIVFQNDLLVTTDSSQAQVVFSDHTMMTFKEKTVLYVQKYNYSPEVKEGKSVGSSVFSLIEGGFRTITGAIAKKNPDDYQVSTDVATIGVRGTDYAANFRGCKLLMKFNSGTPFVKNQQGSLTLTAASPYAAVEINKAPIVLKSEPSEFKVNLQIVPANFSPQSLPKTEINKIIGGLQQPGGGGGGACVPGSSGGGFIINFK